MADRSHLSIGEVLSLLRDEFPDVTISKIRFLESQGLVDPERTPSGYRKFYDYDVDRLRWILRQQRENFLPLKVIRGRLNEHGDRPGAPDPAPGDAPPPLPPSAPAAGGLKAGDGSVPSPGRHFGTDRGLAGGPVSAGTADPSGPIDPSGPVDSDIDPVDLPSGRSRVTEPAPRPDADVTERASRRPAGGVAPRPSNPRPAVVDEPPAAPPSPTRRVLGGLRLPSGGGRRSGPVEVPPGPDAGTDAGLVRRAERAEGPDHGHREHGSTPALFADLKGTDPPRSRAPAAPSRAGAVGPSAGPSGGTGSGGTGSGSTGSGGTGSGGVRRVIPTPGPTPSAGANPSRSSVGSPAGRPPLATPAGRPAPQAPSTRPPAAQPAARSATPGSGPAPTAGPRPRREAVVPTAPLPWQPEDGETYTAAELAAEVGGTPRLIAELEQYGLIATHAVVAGTPYFDSNALFVARAAASLAEHGVEARHLRVWRNAVDRESDLFAQLVLPLLRQRNPQARLQAAETLGELARIGGELRSALIERAIANIR